MRAPRCAAQLPTAPAAACAPEAAGWGLGDLKAVADDVSRMISPLPAFQGAPQGSWRASRHFQGIARGPHSRAGPVSAVGSGWPRLPGLMVAVFSVKERLVQHIFAAPGALPCLIFRSCCCCWLPHRGRYCCLLFIRGLRCVQTARASLAPHFFSAARCVPRAHGRAGGVGSWSRSFHLLCLLPLINSLLMFIGWFWSRNAAEGVDGSISVLAPCVQWLKFLAVW